VDSLFDDDHTLTLNDLGFYLSVARAISNCRCLCLLAHALHGIITSLCCARKALPRSEVTECLLPNGFTTSGSAANA
jgi:hypothetical protein